MYNTNIAINPSLRLVPEQCNKTDRKILKLLANLAGFLNKGWIKTGKSAHKTKSLGDNMS